MMHTNSMYYLIPDVLFITKISDKQPFHHLSVVEIPILELKLTVLKYSHLSSPVVPGMAPKPPKGHFNVLYFASAASFTSMESQPLPAPLPLRKLFDALDEKHPGMKDNILNSSLVTVNLTYVDVPEKDDDPNQVIIEEGDEVAIIPPVSSG